MLLGYQVNYGSTAQGIVGYKDVQTNTALEISW